MPTIDKWIISIILPCRLSLPWISPFIECQWRCEWKWTFSSVQYDKLVNCTKWNRVDSWCAAFHCNCLYTMKKWIAWRFYCVGHKSNVIDEINNLLTSTQTTYETVFFLILVENFRWLSIVRHFSQTTDLYKCTFWYFTISRSVKAFVLSSHTHCDSIKNG